MKEMKGDCFEMFLVIEMQIGFFFPFISLNGRHRPQLKRTLAQEEEPVWETDHSLEAQGQPLPASDHNKILFGGKRGRSRYVKGESINGIIV